VRDVAVPVAGAWPAGIDDDLAHRLILGENVGDQVAVR
jgi:hypothetical protein